MQVLVDKPKLHLVDKYTFEDILIAYLDCRKCKRTTEASLDFELDYLRNLEKLLYEINTETYEILPYDVFIIVGPKPREI